METEAEFDGLIVSQSENHSPTNHRSEPNRLRKDNSMEMDFQTSIEADELERENASDGLDPLFEDAHQYKAKRVLEFDDNECGLSEDKTDFEYGTNQNNNKGKKRRNGATSQGNEDKKRRINTDREKIEKTSKGKKATSNRTQNKERKAHQAQLADFQRVMRERKNVGFKSVPMVEKSISSVLEKIRQRKMELSKKRLVFTEKDQAIDGVFAKDQASDDGVADKVHASEDSVVLKDQIKKDGVGDKDQIEEDGVFDKDQGNAAPLKWTTEDKQITNNNPLVDDITQSFRAPINDTQDLFLDMRSDSQGDELNDFSCPAEDIAPSAPSLNLEIDSAFADDISSNDEGSDKENINPHPKHLLRESSPATEDPVKKFLDEEAEEDDSDNDLLDIQEKDEEDSSDMEENCDYIATDVAEKQIDRLRGNQRHQEWCQQQDEAETNLLLQKLHYGVKQSEPSVSDDEDADTTRDKEDVDTTKDIEDEEDEYDRDDHHVSSSRVTTKRLKQMIPQMFTDEDDGYVSSGDEETEIRLSKQYILQKVAVEKQSNFLSTAGDETSREVFGRIKKLNVIPETKKKAKTSSVFDALVVKGTSYTSSKSSFLQRASCHPGPSSHRRGPSTGRSFIFGRDDSNSRSSMSLPEESPNLGQRESHEKKSSSTKFVSSQAKWSTQHTEMVGDAAYSNSLFDILRSSSVKTGYDTRENIVDHQTIFAAFRSVKKQLKLQGRSSQGE
ncbi:nucleolin 2 isoform X1 [Beta vulgaris subsp. vulgaris]|uniref:nucleolin 2 isoform X1 n=1 Tax=Beta vulgaris subsp. vulgaris TaxID=3555 RepID=UPI002036A7C1|nr:nucleolin 2 isoform X1 [Beta vulgaris subsp. vulgaris]